LKPLGVPTQRIALTLLLSLRFMSLVFEEVRWSTSPPATAALRAPFQALHLCIKAAEQ
jgi:hypothetical protein